MDEDLRAFYDFNSMHMEPWDGPAGIVMSDGRFAACGLDRNGLRPARYVVTKDKLITLASEVGIWDYSAGRGVGERPGRPRRIAGDRYAVRQTLDFLGYRPGTKEPLSL